MEDSRTLVYKTLECRGPERPPRHVWDIQWTYTNFPNEICRLKELYPDDIVWCPRILKEDAGCIGDQYAIGTYIDEWGCVFENKFETINDYVKSFGKFISARAVTMLIEIAGVWFLVELIHMQDMLGKLFIQFVVIVLNYLFSKFFVFKKNNR